MAAAHVWAAEKTDFQIDQVQTIYLRATTKIGAHNTLPGKTDIINDSQYILQAWNKYTHHGAKLRSSFLSKQKE
jgi:pectate lyase